MDVRKLVRGYLEWDQLERITRDFADRYNEPVVRVEFLEADNWLSTPFVVNDKWFVKVVSRRNSLVHAVFTSARNLGAFSRGTEGLFEYFDTPIEMARHEFEAAVRMQDIGVNVPAPVEVYESDGLGVIVFEYLPDFRTLDDLEPAEAREYADELIDALAVMHENGIAHGDLRGENVLVHRDELYFIDATNVRDDRLPEAQAYDVACALGVLAPLMGVRDAVEVATRRYSEDELLAAREFLDFVNIRPDHDFNAQWVKGEIERRANRPDGE